MPPSRPQKRIASKATVRSATESRAFSESRFAKFKEPEVRRNEYETLDLVLNRDRITDALMLDPLRS